MMLAQQGVYVINLLLCGFVAIATELITQVQTKCR